ARELQLEARTVKLTDARLDAVKRSGEGLARLRRKAPVDGHDGPQIVQILTLGLVFIARRGIVRRGRVAEGCIKKSAGRHGQQHQRREKSEGRGQPGTALRIATAHAFPLPVLRPAARPPPSPWPR